VDCSISALFPRDRIAGCGLFNEDASSLVSSLTRAATDDVAVVERSLFINSLIPTWNLSSWCDEDDVCGFWVVVVVVVFMNTGFLLTPARKTQEWNHNCSNSIGSVRK
jgi:hypothetical protein